LIFGRRPRRESPHQTTDTQVEQRELKVRREKLASEVSDGSSEAGGSDQMAQLSPSQVPLLFSPAALTRVNGRAAAHVRASAPAKVATG
jgi:hypothetical protein